MSQPRPDRLPRTFWWANATQFGGAMNDNLFKLFMIYALLDWQGADRSAEILASVGLTFALPFLLIIPIAGSFADHFSKQWMIVRLKALEALVMGFGIFALTVESSPLLYVTMLLMSAQSALFGPCKYGIIPEQVRAERLSRANGMIQLFTFLAIIAGTIIAPELSLLLDAQYAKAAWICLFVAVGGFLASLKIEPTPDHPARKVNFNGFANLFHSSREIRKDGFLALAIISTAFFSLIGAFVQLNVLDYGAQHLGLLPEQATRLFLLTAIGIGLGSVFAGWISGRSIEFGIVPVGAGLMFGGLVVLGTVPPGSTGIAAACMFLLGLAAGMFIVPLESFIQYRSPPDRVGSIKAAGGFLSWIGILTASGLLFLNSSLLGFTAQGGFLLISVLLLVLTVFSLWILPDFFMRFVVMVVTRTLYRLRVYGLDNLPHDRAALLVANHVSLMDAILLLSSQQRRIRMLMSRNVYNTANPFVQWVVRLAGVILIQDSDGPKKLLASLQQARKALDDGYLVCIFAEGGLTLTGMLRPFKPGFERIVKGSDHPIIPVYIGGAWGSVSSWRGGGHPRLQPFREWRYPVSVHFGRELPPTATGFEVRQAVSEVSCEVYEVKKPERGSLAHTYLRSARHNWNRPAVLDSDGTSLTHGELATQGILLRRELHRRLGKDEPRVGLIFPPGIEGMLANLAVALDRRVPVNLDPRHGEAFLHRAYAEAGLQTLLTSKSYREQFPNLPMPPRILYLEELRSGSSKRELRAIRKEIRYLPGKLMAHSLHFDPDEEAAVLYTRGTTGKPKGVCLSHHNLLGSIEALSTVLRPGRPDTLLATLGLHNSFAFTALFWLPLLRGMCVACHPDPGDAGTIGRLARSAGANVLPSAPVFLQDYARSVHPDQFKTLRHVFTAGDPLPPEIAQAFAERFGLLPLEAYGSAELSGAVALSLPDVRVDRFRETGVRPGRQGRLLPGIAMKIVDPETGQALPPGEEGQICIKGAVVMSGYLAAETARPPVGPDGWYSTNDYGILDADGFFSVRRAPAIRSS